MPGVLLAGPGSRTTVGRLTTHAISLKPHSLVSRWASPASDTRTPRPSDLTHLLGSEAACSAALRCEFSMVRLVLSKALGDLGARGVGTEEGAAQDGHPGDV